MIKFSSSKPRALFMYQTNTVKILGLTISTLDPHWGLLEKVPQLPGPNHPFFVRTKKSPAILKILICSTVYPTFTCSVELVRSELTYDLEQLCYRKCVMNFGFRNVVGAFKDIRLSTILETSNKSV